MSYGAGPDGGRLYNGFPATTVTEAGAGQLGIHLVGRWCHVACCSTCPGRRAIEILEPGYPITPTTSTMRARWPDHRRARRRRAGPHRPDRPSGPPRAPGARRGAAPVRDLVAYTWPTPGLTMATAAWFHEHDVAAVATDTMVLEVYPVRTGTSTCPSTCSTWSRWG